MGNMCDECFELFDDFYKFDVCPRRNCTGDVVHVDDLIQTAIQIINIKGYKTLFCCSSHDYDKYSSSYIKFDDEIDLPNIPEGFTYDGNSIIRKEIITTTIIDRHTEMCENAKIMLQWALSLPVNPLMEAL